MPQGIAIDHAPAELPVHAAAQPADLRVPLEGLLAAITTTGAARAATLRVHDEPTGGLRLLGAAQVPRDFMQRLTVMEDGCGACGEATHTHREVCREEACKCARAISAEPAQQGLVRVIPLTHGDRACGVLTLFGCADRDGHADLFAMLPALGELLGMALENCRMSDEKLVASLTQERHLLANEIHDALAQNLTSVRIRTSLLRRAVAEHDDARAHDYLDEINASLSVAHARVRELITHFRTEMDPRGLLPALESTIAELRSMSGMKIAFANHVHALDLTGEQELQVFYIAREALTNAAKHSRASEIRLSLARWGDRYELEVEDDGIGIEPADAEQHGHFGLNIMRERARHIGGELAFENRAGHGTRVRLSFPAPRPDQEESA